MTTAYGPAFMIGKFEFEKMVKSPFYVDKTMFIKSLIEGPDFVLISAPQRFGKSTNMNMLKRFLQIEVNEHGLPIKSQTDSQTDQNGEQVNIENSILFENTNIFKEKDFFNNHFGSYPVVYVDFKGIVVTSFEAFLSSVRTALCKSFEEHLYLKKSKIWLEYNRNTFDKYTDDEKHKVLTEVEIQTGLVYLSKILYRHFNKEVYVLIDEYDSPISRLIHNECLSKTDAIRMVHFMSLFMSNLVKGNSFVSRALMNACASSAAAAFSSNANNIEHYPFLSEHFCKFYGFTENEVTTLLLNANMNEKLEEVQEYYNGYTVELSNKELLHIYNPQSIMKYLNDKVAGNYWAGCSLSPMLYTLCSERILNKIADLMNYDDVEIMFKEKLHFNDICSLQFILNEAPNDLLNTNVDLFLQYLYENGYLHGVNKENMLTLKIPNSEVRRELSRSLFAAHIFAQMYQRNTLKIDDIVKSLRYILNVKKPVEGSFIILANHINHLYRALPRFPKNHFEFHAQMFYFISKAFSGVTVTAEPFTRLGKGLFRCSIVIIDGNAGIVIQLNIFEGIDSVETLNQIIDKKYFSILERNNVDEFVLLGIHMNRDKRVSVTYLVNSYNKQNALTVVCSR